MVERSSRNYLLILLMVILAFNLLDRLALGIVLQDIKADLDLTDTQLGFLTGIAFALFYSLMGIPIARWADRGNRVTIISVTAALWSVAVAACGAAASFTQLLLIRVAVAVGEAGCIPPAHSLIADHFPRAERPRAISRYMLGIPLGLTLGYFGAGWLNELYGWRATFVILGLPGIALALLARFTLRDPRRVGASDPTRTVASRPAAPSAAAPTLRDVCVTLWKKPAFRHLLISNSVWAFFGYGILQWTPAFFVRSHAMSTGELGMWFALIYGIGGAIGIYAGGEWATRVAAGNERLQLNACALSFVFFAVVAASAFLATDYHVAFAALALGSLGGNMAQGPIYAAIQSLVPSPMRAVAIALVYLFANLIGMGLGPLAVGALSDALLGSFGNESLRYALVLLCPGYFWAAWHLWRAGRTVIGDLKATQNELPRTTGAWAVAE
jgi:MFS transporter, Spinster family, sphingosine-1-phosphate transporter